MGGLKTPRALGLTRVNSPGITLIDSCYTFRRFIMCSTISTPPQIAALSCNVIQHRFDSYTLHNGHALIADRVCRILQEACCNRSRVCSFPSG